jgi:heterodisulfide reductase subunit C
MDFGFSISKTRQIDFDRCDLSLDYKIDSPEASFRTCLDCGTCTSTCSAGSFSDFNIRRTHALFRRGQYEGLARELDKCMLCGKCTLVCPRSINLRRLIIKMRTVLAEPETSSDMQDYLNEL